MKKHLFMLAVKDIKFRTAFSNVSATSDYITAMTIANTTGNVTIGGTLDVTGNITGTLATSAQPNITSVGTLSSLNVSGNTTIDGSLNVSNIITSGGQIGNADSLYKKQSKFFFANNFGANQRIQFYKLYTQTTTRSFTAYNRIMDDDPCFDTVLGYRVYGSAFE